LKANPYLLLSVTDPTCPYCKLLKPKWDEAAAKLKKIAPNVALANIELTAENEEYWLKKTSLNMVPHIKWFKDGKEFDFINGR
jgi:thioredoxin-related protein